MAEFPVEKILTEDKKVTGIMLKSGKIISCDMVVLATGGASYPGTGFNRDGYKMAKELGHTMVPLKPSFSAFDHKRRVG